MDPKVSAIERAFQMAKSGEVSNIEDIKTKLKREGYNPSDVYVGRSLNLQLRKLIKAAHSGPLSCPGAREQSGLK
jgi:hypothetical protein